MAKTPESNLAAIRKFNAQKTKNISLRLNKSTDADILSHLEEQESMMGYIKRLIREDIARK